MASSRGGRERWKSRIGMILAAAGNAVGIGNLLRFPGQAAANGGGAFMIPYFVSLLVLGLPMMWIAWTIGRFGGRHHHGTTPGMFDSMIRRPYAKYLGVLGLAVPMVFILFYTYIEAWCLAYAWFSWRGSYLSTPGRTVDLNLFFNEFTGMAPTHNYFAGPELAALFFLITVFANMFVLYRGVNRGLEWVGKIAMPLLFLFGLVLAFKVLTLPAMKGSVAEGLNFLYNPDFSLLLTPTVWLAAAGQIFFTLSIGMGTMETYASYLRPDDDVALNGLTTASLNEFIEVIFGSAIAIPAAVVFFGLAAVPEIAASGSFNIGMVSMAEIMRGLGAEHWFGTIWFLLLFLAAFTSSVAVAQPALAFLEDEAGLSRQSASGVLLIFWVLGTLPVILLFRYGALAELDFWSGTLGLVFFAAIESILFAWVFGIERGWKELMHGAQLRVPRVFRFVMKWVTPFVLVAVLGFWFLDAIMTNSLAPTPTLHWGVEGRAALPGDFAHLRPAEDSPAGERLATLEETVRRAVSAERRDLAGWAVIELAPGASPKVVEWTGDPTLIEIAPAAWVEEWVGLQSFDYTPPPGAPVAPLRVTVAFEARYRALAIWITRWVALGYVAIFTILIHSIWSERRRLREESGRESA